MSRELLKINRLPTIGEFAFLLLDVLDGGGPMQQYELSSICKRHSFNLAQSYDDGIRFLSFLSLIRSYPNSTVERSQDGAAIWELKDHDALCLFITKRLIDHLHGHGLLADLFNTSVVSFDDRLDCFYIQTSAIPLEYPMLALFFTRMGIASPQAKSKSRLLINNRYKSFFEKEILLRAISVASVTSDTITIEQKFNPVMNGISIFISYSHKDEAYKDDLVNHLSSMKRQGVIQEWNDRQLTAGDEWDPEIRAKLEKADIILCLISSDFMASNYINDVEIKKALERYKRGEVKIVPIILRPCDLSSFPISKFQALPKDAKPISTWPDRDEAFLNVVLGLKKLVAKK